MEIINHKIFYVFVIEKTEKNKRFSFGRKFEPKATHILPHDDDSMHNDK